jgi:hypothetical protein
VRLLSEPRLKVQRQKYSAKGIQTFHPPVPM